jgi:beta-glucoside operon transcriptional antiterminator
MLRCQQIRDRSRRGMSGMKANKVFNNNAVAVFWHDGREAVLVGSGIGFGRRPGDTIDEKKIQKVYFIQDELQSRFLQLLGDARPEALQAAEEIIAYARSQGMELKNQLILSLTDHICFALERFEQGISLPYLMLSETKLLYPRAFEIGQWSLEKIRQLCGAELPGYEAGYIALQLASGEMNGEEAYDALKLVGGVTEIIKNTYGIELNPDDLDTIRLTTHLKFLAQRILRRSQWNDDDMDGIFQMLMFRNPRNRDCIAQITGYIRNQFSYELNHQEKVYLLIHLSKIFN